MTTRGVFGWEWFAMEENFTRKVLEKSADLARVSAKWRDFNPSTFLSFYIHGLLAFGFGHVRSQHAAALLQPGIVGLVLGSHREIAIRGHAVHGYTISCGV